MGLRLTVQDASSLQAESANLNEKFEIKHGGSAE